MRCHEIAMLHGGRIIAAAPPNEVLQRTQTDNLEDAFLVLSGSTYASEVHHA
jgi:ABC-type Na+ transport system ATPase subunit NatA